MRYEYDDATMISAADISRHFGLWQDRALRGPVVVTHHGRPRVVLVSADHYAHWRRAGDGDGPAQHLDYEACLGEALDHVRQGFIAFDKDLTVTGCNRVAEAFFGKDYAQTKGQPFAAAFPMLAHPRVLTRMRQVLLVNATDELNESLALDSNRCVQLTFFSYAHGAALLFDPAP